MSNDANNMEKFEFLLGEWSLEYHIPQSSFSRAATGSGKGLFKRILNDKYVTFDYECCLTTGNGRAHAIFAWDNKSQIYRYWWFEDTGNFASAVCDFISDEVLFLHWNDVLLSQTFRKVDSNKIELKMEQPIAQDCTELILEVILTRK